MNVEEFKIKKEEFLNFIEIERNLSKHTKSAYNPNNNSRRTRRKDIFYRMHPAKPRENTVSKSNSGEKEDFNRKY